MTNDNKADEALRLAGWLEPMSKKVAEMLRDYAALLSKIDSEKQTLRGALRVAKAQIAADRAWFAILEKNPMLFEMMDQSLREAGQRSCDSALVIIDDALGEEKS